MRVRACARAREIPPSKLFLAASESKVAKEGTNFRGGDQNVQPFVALKAA